MPPQRGLLTAPSEVIDLRWPTTVPPSLEPLDRTGERYVTALGDRREAPVACWACQQPTLALDATCDTCHARMSEGRVA